ncbi:MAG: RecB family exonuclease [Patescibacteria group bacterium]|jgi:ATP-dependent helicase/DNAse subunit B
MPGDKYTAVWVSHTSIGDFLKCPRAYYLNNVYRDPKSGHKIQIMAPPLALGQAVHEVLESLSMLPTEKRLSEPIMGRFNQAWSKVSGKRGGFPDPDTEEKYKKRGEEMLRRVINNPGPLARKAVKIQMDLPHYWLSEEDNIILCGKIDWLEYLESDDSVHIIDFKTSTRDEDPESLQLPIYNLLVHNCQKRKVSKASYWYLERSDTLTEKTLPNLEESKEKVLKLAKEIKLARQLNRFKCPHKNGCYACRPLERVVNGDAEFVGVNEYNQDVYVINKSSDDIEGDSIIL